MIQGLRAAPEDLRVGSVWTDIVRHPYEYLVRRWNWKAALTSALLRSTIFFSVNLSAGREAAVGAMLTEFGYRFLFSGGVGSVTQAFRKCRPAWAAALSISAVIPLFSHIVEFSVHFLRGTPRITASVGVSIAFTIFSALFNLYVMRRGVLVVGGECKSLLEDLAALPPLLIAFLSSGPLELLRLTRLGSPIRK